MGVPPIPSSKGVSGSIPGGPWESSPQRREGRGEHRGFPFLSKNSSGTARVVRRPKCERRSAGAPFGTLNRNCMLAWVARFVGDGEHTQKPTSASPTRGTGPVVARIYDLGRGDLRQPTDDSTVPAGLGWRWFRLPSTACWATVRRPCGAYLKPGSRVSSPHYRGTKDGQR